VLGLCAVDFSALVIGSPATEGYVVLVLFNTFMLLALLVTTMSLELRDLWKSTGALVQAIRLRAWALCGLATIVAAAGVSLVLVWQPLGTGLQ
jgi:hypothetical protein